MALEFYVSTNGSDNNGGSSESVIVTGSNATTDGTAIVQLPAGTNLSGVNQGGKHDTIRIAGQTTGVNGTDIFEITAVDDPNDRVTVTPSPAYGTNQDWVIGGAWQTLQRSMNVVRAGERVWVKIGTYTAGMEIKREGQLEKPIVVTGYKTTPGDVADELAAKPHLWPSDAYWDSWRVVIDGQESLTAGITAAAGADDKLYYVFENFQIKDCAGVGVSLISFGNVVLRNCRVSGCISAPGVYIGDPNNCLESCCFDNNGADVGAPGVAFRGVMFNCDVFANDGAGVVGLGNCTVVSCRVWDNGEEGFYAATTVGPQVLINNTFIGKEQESGHAAVYLDANVPASVINNILYNWDIGIKCDKDMGLTHIARSNLFSNNNTDRVKFPVGLGDISAGDPGFVNVATNDYRLRFASLARGAGAPPYTDIGAEQRREIATHSPTNLGVQT